ncbi:serine/threonine-protein kinase ULK1 isoform X3 [Anguilla anguilla]|uniref:serine/threonine-protein kinase ULK1 isoform X3 n=1 Tax=Anguilla anguilla TaxID=7936 RepID=UPI0015AF7D4D|nr:serine/threonine-protein kinase ULK1 isoform X3 [Anguilla anguilla]
METVGKFEFSRKDLVGHGAFAVVFKGRHREKHDWEVAVKCINKKNLAKSQTLLGKEIKILKELKHENIVALHDFQETASSVYLVMEYCNGGDLADCLHSKGTLSEDTIRVFLHQIAGAMRVLQAKGVIHRDLKPQNILLSHAGGRKASPSNTCIKIADFGFARYLQSNMMAATLCGSPMYMAPEVIMSQTYDAKADLWSIGTIVFQCLTGKAPFQASSPQDLRLFYEKNKNLNPNIPRETSSHLRHLLQGLLQRNPRDRMDFDEFFQHPFLELNSPVKKSALAPVPSYPSSGSASSCSSSSTSHLASPPLSVAELQQLRPKAAPSLSQDCPDFLLKDSAGGSSKDSSCDTDDFVIVPAHLPGELTSEVHDGKIVQDSLIYCGSSLLASGGLGSQLKTPPPSPPFSGSRGGRPMEFSGGNHGSYGQSAPIPVPTQIHNYQRMEHNLHSPRGAPPVRRCNTAGGSLCFGKTGASPPHPGGQGAGSRRLSVGGSRPLPPSPQALAVRDTQQSPSKQGLGSRLHSAPCLLEASSNCRQKIRKQHSDPLGQVRPLHPSPRLNELMHRSPLPTILGSPSKIMPPFEFPKPPSSSNLVTLLAHQGLVLAPAYDRPAPDLTGPALPPGVQPGSCFGRAGEESKGPFGRSLSAGRLSDLLLKAAFGPPLLETDRSESSTPEGSVDATAPPGGGGSEGGMVLCSGSPVHAVFTVGSPPHGSTPPQTAHARMFSVGSSGSLSSAGSLSSRQTLAGTCVDGYEGPSSPRRGFTDPAAASLEGAVTFEAPELPEETLMEQEQSETLRSLRFTLAFARCVAEIAGGKAHEAEAGHPPVAPAPAPVPSQPHSLVADQISLLSRDWSYAEQLVLYMKTVELLSSALHTAMTRIKQGTLYPSSTVKQVVRRLNDLYKSSVKSCRCLGDQLQPFFQHKQQLMDRINSITAEKLIFSHTIQMVQSAALDEMFHQGGASVQQYHKALLLMDGLSLLITDQADALSITKCKQCIERRLSALQSGPWP